MIFLDSVDGHDLDIRYVGSRRVPLLGAALSVSTRLHDGKVLYAVRICEAKLHLGLWIGVRIHLPQGNNAEEVKLLAGRRSPHFPNTSPH